MNNRLHANALTGAAGKIVLILAISIGFSACASRTSVSSTWHDKSYKNQGFERVIVVGVSEDTDKRMSFEEAIVQDLTGPNTAAWSSVRFMPVGEEINETSLRTLVDEKNADAIVITKVTSLDVTSKESGGRSDVIELQQDTGTTGMVSRRRSGTVFQYDYEESIEPVYITTEYSTAMTTEVFDTASGEHVYTVVTTANKQETVAQVVDVISDAIAARLRSDGVIR